MTGWLAAMEAEEEAAHLSRMNGILSWIFFMTVISVSFEKWRSSVSM